MLYFHLISAANDNEEKIIRTHLTFDLATQRWVIVSDVDNDRKSAVLSKSHT